MYHTMIVDDEPLMRTYLTRNIPAFSALFDVSAVAKDGLEAMELLKEAPVDVVITDIKMPEVDGLSLARHIHENYPDITVIVISGFSDFEYAQKAIRYNVKDYLLKPLVDKTLIDLLDALATRFEQERGSAHFKIAGRSARHDPLRHRLLCALLEGDSARTYRLYRELREKGGRSWHLLPASQSSSACMPRARWRRRPRSARLRSPSICCWTACARSSAAWRCMQTTGPPV